jgi:integrase
MAFIEQRGTRFRIIFRHAGTRYAHTLKTGDRKQAETLKGGIEHTLMLIDQHLLQVPAESDLFSFVVSGGKVVEKPEDQTEGSSPPKPMTLHEVKEKYIETHSIGAMEKNSLATVSMHLNHFVRSFGAEFSISDLTLPKLQEHVNRRAKAKGLRGRKLSAVTLRKEMASLRAAWNWAARMGFVSGMFPHRGLVYPKADEKPPFQTWKEIERQIERERLSESEQDDLWDCLFLTLPEIAEFLAFVKENARQPFTYPMVCLAAHTGARRSEVVRARIRDVDLEAATILIQEKKRSKGKRTTRRVPLSPFLVGVLKQWLSAHPGGQFLFCQQAMVTRSKKDHSDLAAVTRDEAHDHFRRTVNGSKWHVLRGWHVLRHSFISNCAAKGIDQRMLDRWVGHTTEEMRRRYLHLIPSNEQAAIGTVFA